MPQEKFEDAVLANQLKKGSEEALGALYDRYYIYLVRVATRLCGDANIAEDLAADAFVKLWRYKAKLKPQLSVQAYLTSIVRNLAINYLKKSRKTVYNIGPQELRLDETDIEQAYIDAETYRVLLDMISNLNDGEQNVMTLLLEGYTVNEVVKRLKRSQSAVSQSKAGGITKLKKMLRNYAFAMQQKARQCRFKSKGLIHAAR